MGAWQQELLCKPLKARLAEIREEGLTDPHGGSACIIIVLLTPNSNSRSFSDFLVTVGLALPPRAGPLAAVAGPRGNNGASTSTRKASGTEHSQAR